MLPTSSIVLLFLVWQHSMCCHPSTQEHLSIKLQSYISDDFLVCHKLLILCRLPGMRRVSCISPSTSCMSSYWVRTKARWFQSTLSTPPRSSALTPTRGRRWVPEPETQWSACAEGPGVFHCMSLCWPAGVTCVLWLRTRGEIRPLPAPTEEQVHDGVLQHGVYWQLCGCQTN